MTKWYVTVNKNSDHADDPDVRVWTVSRDPDDTGWETDGGFPGYGLTKHDAEELANAANRVEKLEVALKFLIRCEEVHEAAAKAYGQIYVNKGLDFARELIGMEKKDD